MNKKLKIAIYTICKNEEHFVQKWAASNSEADIRLICDTGSTDSTINLLKEQNVNVISITVVPWRFDVARNTALNLLPADVDVCIWQDLDEELLPGWRQEIEKHWEDNATIANHKYRHNKGAWQWHSKIHSRHNCIWTGTVHETLKWFSPEKEIWLHEFYLDEHQDTIKSRSHYLSLLLTKIKEGDANWRTFYFLSNEYGEIDKNESLRYKLESYNLVDSSDTVTKNYIARGIANHYASIENINDAYKWFNISNNHSNERESLYYYAQLLHHQNKWDECYITAKKCIEITEPRSGFTFDPNAWSYMIYDIAAIASYKLGLYKNALEYGLKALEMNPNDQRLTNNLEFYKEAK